MAWSEQARRAALEARRRNQAVKREARYWITK